MVCDAGDGSGGVGSDAGEGLQVVGVFGESAVVFVDDNFCGFVEVSCA